MQNYKANISILIVFVLVASGLIGLLSLFFVKQIMFYNNSLVNYYKSYYMSKAGIETALTLVKKHNIGFEFSLSGNNDFLDENFECYPGCNLSLDIKSNSYILNKDFGNNKECNKNNYFVLYSGETYILPLYKDDYKKEDGIKKVFGNPVNENIFDLNLKIILLYENNVDNSNYINLGFVTKNFPTISKKLLIHENVINDFLWSELKDSDSNIKNRMNNNIYQNYLIISNPNTGDSAIRFCLESKKHTVSSKKLAMQVANIQSIGKFGTNIVGLNAFYSYSLPTFLGHTSLGF